MHASTVARCIRSAAACVGFAGWELIRLQNWLEEIADRSDPPGLDYAGFDDTDGYLAETRERA